MRVRITLANRKTCIQQQHSLRKKSQINNTRLYLGLSLTCGKPGPRATYGQPSNLMWPTTTSRKELSSSILNCFTAFNNTCFAHPSKNPWFGISNPSMSDFSSLYMLTREGGAGTPFWTEKQSPWAWKRHFWFHLNVFAKTAWTIPKSKGRWKPRNSLEPSAF